MALQIRKDIVELCQELGRIEGIKTLAMTSNGLVLARKLPALKAAGLNLLNISLDTLDPLKFPLITRRDGFDLVMRTINLALEMGYVIYAYIHMECLILIFYLFFQLRSGQSELRRYARCK